MSYIAAEDVAKAKKMDLLTYLRNYEPQNPPSIFATVSAFGKWILTRI